MRISLEGVEALEAVAEAGSFAEAGRVLHKVPSAVSYQIKQLEQALGVGLFDRSGHRAVLTPAGTAILDEARLLLARARRMEALAERFSEGWEERLHVVVDGAFPTAPLLRALATVGEQEAPTHIQLRTEYLSGVLECFERSRADVFLSLHRPDHPMSEVVELPPLVFRLVASPEHPACRRRLDPEELTSFLELSVHDSASGTASIDTNQHPGARVFYVGDFRAKLEGLIQGLGIGWMPEHLIDEPLQSGRLKRLDLSAGATRRFGAYLGWRRDRPLGRAGGALVERILEEV